MNKLSVTIITYNEEKNIRECLDSVRWADEIVVLDSCSTDSTERICREYTDKVFQNEWLGYGRQKNLCAERAENDWIFNLDADEVVTPELRAGLMELLSSTPSLSAYLVPRKNYFGERWIRYCGWYPDYIVRLYNKKRASFLPSDVHESVQVDGRPGMLRGPIKHYTYSNLSDYISRQNRYSSLAAQGMAGEGREVRWYDLSLRPIFAFIKVYALRMGFREGGLGFILSVGHSFYTFLKYVKLWEIKEMKK
ncbi:MAG: glycosyltransferase family 2 protein [Nitrospinota bacterium]